MFHTLTDYGPNVVIGERIKDTLAVAARLHKLTLFEKRELMAHR